MKFIVTKRVSSIGDEKKPCDEAKREELTPLDYRDVESLEKARSKVWFKEWYESGTNHREENGKIVCEKKQKEQRWVVEIKSLEELLEFQTRYGDITIRNSSPYKEVKKEIIIP